MSENMRETKIASDRIYSGRVVTLDVDRVRLPDGVETVREVVRHAGAVVILPIFSDGTIGLVRQFRYPVGEVLLELPAGTLEQGEGARVCAARELAEETGWQANALHELGSFFTTPGFTDEVLHSYVADGLTRADGGVVADADEFIELVTVSIDDALAMMQGGEIRDAKTMAAVFLAIQRGFISPSVIPSE
jgi:ADP-ribose pyrophosphatase